MSLVFCSFHKFILFCFFQFFLPFLKRLYQISLKGLCDTYRAYSDASAHRDSRRKIARLDREVFANQLTQLFERLKVKKRKMYKLKRSVILAKRDLATTSNPDWQGFTAIDYENLKIENKELQTKLLEKDDEVSRLYDQLNTYVTKLAIVSEKRKHTFVSELVLFTFEHFMI